MRKYEDIYFEGLLVALSTQPSPGCAPTPTLTHQTVQYTNQPCSVSYSHTMYFAMFFGKCLFTPKFPVKGELQLNKCNKV